MIFTIEKYMYMYYNKTIEKEQNTDRTKQEETKMKVKFTDTMKNIVTVAEMPAVRKVIEAEKNDECTATDLARVAARLVFDDNAAMIIEANARIAKNQRVWDAFDEETRDIDVWIEFTAFSEYRSSFIIAGVYLTDLWQLTKDNADEIKSHMYIRRFKEVKG